MLRTSLLPGWSRPRPPTPRRNTGVGLWEIGHVFRHGTRLGRHTGQALPDERDARCRSSLVGKPPAAVELADPRRGAPTRKPARPQRRAGPGLAPTRGPMASPGQVVGAVGGIDHGVLARHDIGERVGLARGRSRDRGRTLPLKAHRCLPAGQPLSVERHRPRLRGPATARPPLRRGHATSADPLVWAVNLFDVYRGTGITDGRRSLAYALRLQALDHTLTDDEVAEVRRRCIEAIESAVPGVVARLTPPTGRWSRPARAVRGGVWVPVGGRVQPGSRSAPEGQRTPTRCCPDRRS